MNQIRVRAADPGRVAAWERHPEHPGGECFVAGDRTHVVAETPFILGRLRRGFLKRVAEQDGPAADEQPTVEAIDATDKARELAEELGLDLADVAAASPGERITCRDVRRFAKERQ
jgi:pyruvate/2-oxoglutarate dehydrogenase complex dihydrolipoamide acyltransferase (E2) component